MRLGVDAPQDITNKIEAVQVAAKSGLGMFAAIVIGGWAIITLIKKFSK